MTKNLFCVGQKWNYSSSICYVNVWKEEISYNTLTSNECFWIFLKQWFPRYQNGWFPRSPICLLRVLVWTDAATFSLSSAHNVLHYWISQHCTIKRIDVLNDCNPLKWSPKIWLDDVLPVTSRSFESLKGHSLHDSRLSAANSHWEPLGAMKFICFKTKTNKNSERTEQL